ncbi:MULTISPECIES: 5'-methylthioadenosine/S-adenosylhomocysteine nucleosidase [Paracoccaceae]|uniref:5'-methylthioadenosine/S-adenosylhomocysteine nucleosidase family protein n=1 Tax=Paracoccaceae TaxID=31989 RepID=UPI00329A538C
MDETLGLFLAANDAVAVRGGIGAGKDGGNEELDRYSKDPRIAIITALPKEMAALKEVLGVSYQTPSELDGAVSFTTTTIEVGTGENKKSEDIVMCQCVKMGNNSAAVAATALLIKYPSIEDILMVGIAGGVPILDWKRGKCPKHVRKGDVVLGDQVIQYDLIKIEVDEHENRARPIPPSARLTTVVNQIDEDRLRGKDDFEKRMLRKIPEAFKRPRNDVVYKFSKNETGELCKEKATHPSQDRPKKAPLVHRGTIGSANALLKSHEYRDELREKFGLAAVEMEGSGIADSAWHFRVGYLAVRGVCDYCDMDKDDNWQMYAAYAAAMYSKMVVERSIQMG